MLFKKIELTFIVTLFAVALTTFVYIFPPQYTQLWLNLEIIIIPTMYLIGYEFMLEKQKMKFEKRFELIQQRTEELERKNAHLRLKLSQKLP